MKAKLYLLTVIQSNFILLWGYASLVQLGQIEQTKGAMAMQLFPMWVVDILWWLLPRVHVLLGRVRYDDRGKRHILSIALPGMALMTTKHLYSHSATQGDITVMRPDSIVIEIPYKAIKAFKDQDPHIDTLIDILGNKKRTQLAELREITASREPFNRSCRSTRYLQDNSPISPLLPHHWKTPGNKTQIAEPKSLIKILEL